MLERARASVAEQTVPPVAHLIGVDFAGVGPARIRNQLAAGVTTDWIGFLDDDDHLEPDHLEILTDAARATGADVIYPDCHFSGPPLPDAHLPRPFDRDYLRERGFFPITLLVSTDAFRDAGGFPEDARYEDWQLWNTIADAGGRFAFVDRKTWTYCTAHPDRRTNR